jgi:predicted 3-demethylubiquinone-9 3-methyltransferase (glyoxalase superfamily)
MKIEQHSKQKITPFLWFNNQAEEAANFYTSVFKNSNISSISRYGDEGPGPKGTAMVVPFQIEGQEFMALNGGPLYSFTPAISFMVSCDNQQEIDELWEKLTSDGGQEVQCGWLTDKYGLSWQIVPTVFGHMMQSKDSTKTKRVMRAMMQMKKMDIQMLEDAYAGEIATI